MDYNYVLYILASAAAVIVGIVVHESAHALAAYLLGDRTARSRGRISLNPMHHIDPFGTVLLPLLMIAAGGPVFAFAKPVPVYLGNLKHHEILVSLAGPASNVVLAVLGAVVLRVAADNAFAVASVLGAAATGAVASFCLQFIAVNLSLAFFNLIPLPPLDGSSILVLFLKGRALDRYYEVQRYAMPILIVVLYVLPTVFGIDLLGMYFDVTLQPVYRLLVRFALGW